MEEKMTFWQNIKNQSIHSILFLFFTSGIFHIISFVVLFLIAPISCLVYGFHLDYLVKYERICLWCSTIGYGLGVPATLLGDESAVVFLGLSVLLWIIAVA